MGGEDACAPLEPPRRRASSPGRARRALGLAFVQKQSRLRRAMASLRRHRPRPGVCDAHACWLGSHRRRHPAASIAVEPAAAQSRGGYSLMRAAAPTLAGDSSRRYQLRAAVCAIRSIIETRAYRSSALRGWRGRRSAMGKRRNPPPLASDFTAANGKPLRDGWAPGRGGNVAGSPDYSRAPRRARARRSCPARGQRSP